MTPKNVALYYYVEILFKDFLINTLNKKVQNILTSLSNKRIGYIRIVMFLHLLLLLLSSFILDFNNIIHNEELFQNIYKILIMNVNFEGIKPPNLSSVYAKGH